MTKILLVDDDPAIVDALSSYLKAENFEIDTCPDGGLAVDKIVTGDHDLIILDVMLPNKSGTEICREAREKSNVPIIMLTAKGEEIDKILGLEIGADDYMPKPFSPRELIARIHAVLRRSNKSAEKSQKSSYSFKDITLFVDQHRVEKNEKSIQLTKSEFAILEKLMENPSYIVTREQLMKEITGYEKYVSDRTVDTHVKNLRKKIEDDPKKPKLVITTRGIGYKLGES